MRSHRLEAATGSVIEALENRRLLSVTLDHGVLTVRGTADNDVLTVFATDGFPDFAVSDNGRYRTFHRADVTGIVILGGDGHDELGVTRAGCRIDIPMTIRGGAGDDTLVGSGAADVLDSGSGEDKIAGSGWSYSWTTDQWSLASPHQVGDDVIHGDPATDQINPPADGDDGGDGFHGAAADLPSMRVHNGVLYLTGTTGDDVINVGTWSERQRGAGTRGQVSSSTAMPWQYGWFAQQVERESVTRVVVNGRGGTDRLQVSRVGAIPLPAFQLTAAGISRDVVVAPGVFRIGSDGSFGELPDTGSVTLDDGVLTVRGSSAADEILIGSWFDDDLVTVRVNEIFQTFALADVREIRVDCGDGDDAFEFYNFSTGLFIPVIANGGAGDDLLNAQDGRDYLDHPMPGPFDGMHATLLGGDGDDTIRRGVSDDYADGGTGNDTLIGFDQPVEVPAPVESDESGAVGDGDLVSAGDSVAESGAADPTVTPSATPPPSAFAGAFATVGSSTEPGVWSDAAADPMGMTREEDGVL